MKGRMAERMNERISMNSVPGSLVHSQDSIARSSELSDPSRVIEDTGSITLSDKNLNSNFQNK